MLNQIIIDILVSRIKESGVNPKTGEIMLLSDIKIQEYRDAVEQILATQQDNYATPHQYLDEGTNLDYQGIKYRLVVKDGQAPNGTDAL